MEAIIVLIVLIWVVAQMAKPAGASPERPSDPHREILAPASRAEPEEFDGLEGEADVEEMREPRGTPLEDWGDPDLMFDEDGNAHADWEDEGDGPYIRD